MKILIITYYWPPSGGGGVQRWLKFSKYLKEEGCEPVVVSPSNADYPSFDSSFLKDAEKIEQIKVPIWEPYQLFRMINRKKPEEKVNTGHLFDKRKSLLEKISLWIRGNVLIPDPRVFWVNRVVKALKNKINDLDADWIITTGPPHSTHLIGLKLKKKYGIKWLADFRDPWSSIDYLDKFYLSPLARRLQKNLEKKVLKTADTVLAVSPSWQKELVKLGGKNVKVITNGYDEEDFKNYKPQQKNPDFAITYTGLLTSYRNPEFLWTCLNDICAENQAFRDRLCLNFVGNIDKQILSEIEKFEHLKPRLTYKGYLDHDAVIKEYEASSLLLIFTNDTGNNSGHIPGKVFEYLAAVRPVLAIGSKNGDVATILSDSSCLTGIFNKAEVSGLRLFVEKVFDEASRKKNPEYGSLKYSRRELTKNLLEILKED